MRVLKESDREELKAIFRDITKIDNKYPFNVLSEIKKDDMLGEWVDKIGIAIENELNINNENVKRKN